MRILYIIPKLRRAGAERLVLDICNELVEKKMAEVLLLVMYPKNEYPELSENIKIVYCSSRVYPSLSRKSKANLEEFNKIVRDFKPDIIHSHLFEAEMLSRWKIFPHIKYITHAHDNMHQLKKPSWRDYFIKKRITEIYERYLLLKRYRICNNNFIVISNNMKEYFSNNVKVSKNKIILQPNAINFKKFNNGLTFKSFDNIKKEIILVTVGRLVKRKNHAFLVDVVKYLDNKKENVKLFIIGSGEEKNNLREKAIKEKISEKIVFIGETDNVVDYYHKADIYVHAATYEPFGLVLLEANATGLPIVCLNGQGNQDIVINNMNGFILSLPNIQLFAEKILQLFNNNKLYTEISKNSVAFAKKYDLNAYIKNLYIYYESLLKN